MDYILESRSPVCGMEAVIDRDAHAYYLVMLHHAKVVRMLWIANRIPAPPDIAASYQRVSIGHHFLMPAPYVMHAPGGIELDPGKLTIIWYPSGDGVGVFYGDTILCASPTTANAKTFPGFTRYVREKTPYGWPFLPNAESVEADVLDAVKFWGFMRREATWQEVQQKHLEVLHAFFGQHEQYYAIDGGKFPPRALVQGRRDGAVYSITAGMSLLPMPKTELTYLEKTPQHCRTELGFAAREHFFGLPEQMAPRISAAANAPWEMLSMLDHGHMIDIADIPGFPEMLLVDPRRTPGMECPEYPGFWGCRINLLWMVPVTAEEIAFAEKHGSAALLDKASDKTRLHIFDGAPKFGG
ncbi:MAG: suppressor of fused domain protein [Oscillospiraceae bacterium]|nr:suppressor of fused domain protein [Oscillospiraceae bacterium]